MTPSFKNQNPPVVAGGIPSDSSASCVLLIPTTSDSAFARDMSVGRYTAQRAGICINAGRTRS